MSTKVATPFTTGLTPKTVVPSRKETVPVAPAGDTVAVNVNGWPTETTVGLATKTVVVGVPGARENVCVTPTVHGHEAIGVLKSFKDVQLILSSENWTDHTFGERPTAIATVIRTVSGDTGLPKS